MSVTLDPKYLLSCDSRLLLTVIDRSNNQNE